MFTMGVGCINCKHELVPQPWDVSVTCCFFHYNILVIFS